MHDCVKSKILKQPTEALGCQDNLNVYKLLRFGLKMVALEVEVGEKIDYCNDFLPFTP